MFRPATTATACCSAGHVRPAQSSPGRVPARGFLRLEASAPGHSRRSDLSQSRAVLPNSRSRRGRLHPSTPRGVLPISDRFRAPHTEPMAMDGPMARGREVEISGGAQRTPAQREQVALSPTTARSRAAHRARSSRPPQHPVPETKASAQRTKGTTQLRAEKAMFLAPSAWRSRGQGIR